MDEFPVKVNNSHPNEGTVCEPRTVTATVTWSDLQYATGQPGRRGKQGSGVRIFHRVGMFPIKAFLYSENTVRAAVWLL